MARSPNIVEDKKIHIFSTVFFKNFQDGAAKELLDIIFPRLSTCNFKSGALSGGNNEHSYLCVLAPNALTEKIFVILWFWYGLVALITSINLITIICMSFNSSFIRNWFLSRAANTTRVR